MILIFINLAQVSSFIINAKETRSVFYAIFVECHDDITRGFLALLRSFLKLLEWICVLSGRLVAGFSSPPVILT